MEEMDQFSCFSLKEEETLGCLCTGGKDPLAGGMEGSGSLSWQGQHVPSPCLHCTLHFLSGLAPVILRCPGPRSSPLSTPPWLSMVWLQTLSPI